MSAFDLLIALAMLVGLAGIVLPFLPGLVLVMAAAVLWGVFGGEGLLGWVIVLVMVVVGTAGMAVAAVLPARRSSAAGAPWWVVMVGAAGVVVGFFVIPVVGALVGGPVAILIAELVRVRALGPAWDSTVEALKGVGIGIGVQLLAGVVMVAVWLSAVLAT